MHFHKMSVRTKMLIKKNTTITIADGTNAANDFVTVGGTPAGILITHSFFRYKCKNMYCQKRTDNSYKNTF